MVKKFEIPDELREQILAERQGRKDTPREFYGSDLEFILELLKEAVTPKAAKR